MKVTKTNAGDSVVVFLVGTIDENDDFKALIGSGGKTLTVNCKGVTRINSMGVKNWLKFFLSFAGSNTKILFVEVPPVLIEQFNMIQNFRCGGEIVSVVAPFHCESCKAHFNRTLITADLIQAKFVVASAKCEKCAASAEFDDDGEEYFAFLKKT